MKLKVPVIGVIAGVVYCVVVVLAGGGPRAYFASPARTALVAVQLAAAVAALFTQGNVSSGQREDRGNRWVLAAFGVIGVLLAVVPPYTDHKDILSFGGEAVRWVGVALTVVGGVLRLWPVFVLGRRFSGLVAIQPDHTLATTGVYGRIRHPSYLGLTILTFGWAVAFRSDLGLALALLQLWPLAVRIRAEEALLASQFGVDYDAYRARTARMIPGIW